MTNRIYLAGIVERAGRILLLRPTPAAPWELPGGPLQQRHPDADVAMGEILESFGLTVPEIAEGFLETLYLPEGNGHIVFNLYHAADWEGEPDIPIGMGAGWFAFDELDAIEMQEEVRAAVLVAYGLREPVNQDAAILQAMAGAATDPSALQPPLVPVPPFEPLPAGSDPATATTAAAQEWARPAIGDEREGTGAPAASTIAGEDGETGAVDAPATDTVRDEPASTEGDDNVIQFPVSEESLEVEIGDPELAGDTGDTDAVAQEPFDNIIDFEIGTPAAPSRDLAPAESQDDDEPVIEMAEQLSRRLRGYDVLRTLGGGTDPVLAHERMRSTNPEIADDVIDFALGEVWATDRLDRRTRSLQVVAMLSALGGRQGPLRSHINGALNHGASPDEVVETLRMVAVYAGFPAALEAWNVMEDVFRTRGVKPGGRP